MTPRSAPVLGQLLNGVGLAVKLLLLASRPGDGSRQSEAAAEIPMQSDTPGRGEHRDLAVGKIALLEDLRDRHRRRFSRGRGRVIAVRTLTTPLIDLTVRNSWPTAPVIPTMAMVGPVGVFPARTDTEREREKPPILTEARCAKAGLLRDCMMPMTDQMQMSMIRPHTSWCGTGTPPITSSDILSVVSTIGISDP